MKKATEKKAKSKATKEKVATPETKSSVAEIARKIVTSDSESHPAHDRNYIQLLLERKAALKQDIFQDTKRDFERFKKHIQQEVASLRSSIPDERIRLYTVDNGDFEIQAFVGGDVLVFQMHTNIFKLPGDHELWRSDYIKADSERGFFGIINIYNFLAASYLKNRGNDLGYLIGRIFINKDEHFMVEGMGSLGTDFKDLKGDSLEDDEICRIIHTSFAYALEFDLLTPPYEVVSKVSVRQMQDTQTNEQISTGKRLGFKFGAEDKDVF